MTKKSNKRFIVNLTENIKSWLAARSKPSEPTPYVLDVGVLEDRVLYSATAMPVQDALEPIAFDTIDSMEVLLTQAVAENAAAALPATILDSQNAAGGEVLEPSTATDAALHSNAPENSVQDFAEDDSATASDDSTDANESAVQSSLTRNAIFIDETLDDLEILLESIYQGEPSSHYDVFMVNRDSNGFTFVVQTLQQANFQYDAIHFVTHGSAGEVQLGSSLINSQNVHEYNTQLGELGQYLSDDADILFYGCSLAESVEGRELLQLVSVYSGADIAASDDLTGHKSLGGDWDLEVQIGVIETTTLPNSKVADYWEVILATFTVTNTNDSGAGSLRQAIIDANALAGSDTIEFAVGSGVISINLSSGLLPTINQTTIIDGWSQPGFAGTPIVVIDGGGVAVAGDGLVLTSTADNSTIRGLVIRDFLGDGIQIDSGSSGNTIVGNYLGSYSTGGGNLGSGDANTGNGINILGNNNTIGGTTAQNRNVIGGNLSNGILLSGTGATNNVIQGNYIGTTATGTVAMGNSGDGIRIVSSANTNTIGGTTTAHGNVIVASGSDGIEITGSNSGSNTITNNWIGLGSDGTTVIGNAEDGIRINGGADNTVIGGIGTGNVILGNRGAGIDIDGTTTDTNIRGNLIGINAAGTVVYGNALSGIVIANGAMNTIIGGTSAGEGNTITDNGLMSATNNAGIFISSTSTGHHIRGNSIYSNRGIGIDLGTAGTTANDVEDLDSGTNNLQNFPTLSAATVNGAGTTVTVSGSINTNVSVTGIVLHFYATPSTGNVNVREGRRYLGTTTVNSDGSGNATFTNISLTGFTGTVAAGELITATATRNSNTSEFSLGHIATSTAGNTAPTSSQVVSATDGGLSLNTSGYSTALQAEDGSTLLGGRTQLSMEFQFRGTTMGVTDQYSLVSYTTPTDGDAFYIGAYKSGGTEAIGFTLNGAYAEVNYDVDALFDGNLHSFALTWTQTSGAWVMYVDGVAIGSGTGVASGQSIGTGGQLGFGIDLDGGSDSWQRGGLFKGTMYDIRVFSDIRTASEIAQNHLGDLPFNEGGLIGNWRFDDLSSQMLTTDAVNGNDLLVRSYTQPGTSLETPGLALRLDENSTTGTVVGQVQGFDVEREARITALLAADSSLRYSAETGKFYKSVSTTGLWSAARTAAESTALNGVNGQLATIRSAYENELVRQLAAGIGNDVWIGATDSTVEGEWRWVDGGAEAEHFWRGNQNGYNTIGAYHNFETGQPNDVGSNEDVIRLDDVTGKWFDADHSVHNFYGYVIEWKADDVLDASNASPTRSRHKRSLVHLRSTATRG